jgi:hypothetical protein
MSDTEHWQGKAKEYVFSGPETYKDKVEFMKSRGHELEEEDYDDDPAKGYIYCKTLIEIDGRWFELSEKKEYDSDICTATIGINGEISFTLNFYNGGCCFAEALLDAVVAAEEAS